MSPSQLKYFQKRSCVYKYTYHSLQSGLTRLLKLRDEGHTVDNCYKCPFCGFYHIGHVSNEKRKKRNIKMINEIIKTKGEKNV